MAESQALINILQGARDTVENTIGVIDIVHHETHEGNNYSKSVVATKTAAQFLNVFLKKGTASLKERHMTFEVSSNQAGVIYLYEMIKTSGTGGTTATLINTNRVSTKASSYRIIVDKSTFSSSTGTLLLASGYGANSGAQRFGGSAASRNEWILKSTKEYLLRFDPSANTTGITLTVGWYEPID